MANWKQITVDTYNNSALELAEYFAGIGSRVDDIEKALSFVHPDGDPKILEIGCGDGRDAVEILKKTRNYTGFDVSEELIKIAQDKSPNGNFLVADATTFEYGKNKYDVVFAFASLLHLSKEDVSMAMKNVHDGLKDGGIFYISLKFSEEYEEKIQEDRFGKRIFYYYNPELIKDIAGDLFITVAEQKGFVTKGTTKWFEMALKKVNAGIIKA